MKWSLIVVAVFVFGILLTWSGVVPKGLLSADTSTYLLYALVALVGFEIGSSGRLSVIFKEVDYRSFLLPLGVAVSSVCFAGLACLFIGWLSWADGMALGSGMGYYSLSSMIITGLKTPEVGVRMASKLGTLALLVNIFREFATLCLAQLLRRYFDPYGLVASAGVTSMDVLLPSIIKYGGKEIMPVAIINGVMLEMMVPFLVTFFCMF